MPRQSDHFPSSKELGKRVLNSFRSGKHKLAFFGSNARVNRLTPILAAQEFLTLEPTSLEAWNEVPPRSYFVAARKATIPLPFNLGLHILYVVTGLPDASQVIAPSFIESPTCHTRAPLSPPATGSLHTTSADLFSARCGAQTVLSTPRSPARFPNTKP